MKINTAIKLMKRYGEDMTLKELVKKSSRK